MPVGIKIILLALKLVEVVLELLHLPLQLSVLLLMLLLSRLLSALFLRNNVSTRAHALPRFLDVWLGNQCFISAEELLRFVAIRYDHGYVSWQPYSHALILEFLRLVLHEFDSLSQLRRQIVLLHLMRKELNSVLSCDVLVHEPPIVISGGFVVAVVISTVGQAPLLDVLLDLVLRSKVHLPFGEALVAPRQGVVPLVSRVLGRARARFRLKVSFNKYLFQAELKV